MDEIGICNLAISLVGGNSIISFADESVEAEECERYYDEARKFCLEKRDWTFASSARQLALNEEAPVVEFANGFNLPSDCLVVRFVSDSADLDYQINHQIDKRVLSADSETVFIKYTKNITDTVLFSPSFRIALSHKLAEFISSAITGDKTLKRNLMAESEVILDDGGAIDGMQGTPRKTKASRLLGARFRYGTRYYGTGNYI